MWVIAIRVTGFPSPPSLPPFLSLHVKGGGVRYTEDRNTRECKATKTTDSFRPIHIPENATFVEEFYLGASGVPDAGVLVQQWVGNTTNPTGKYASLWWGQLLAFLFVLQVNIRFL